MFNLDTYKKAGAKAPEKERIFIMKKHNYLFSQAFLRNVREVQETKDLKEAAQLMSEGPWAIIGVAFDADETPLFILGRIVINAG